MSVPEMCKIFSVTPSLITKRLHKGRKGLLSSRYAKPMSTHLRRHWEAGKRNSYEQIIICEY